MLGGKCLHSHYTELAGTLDHLEKSQYIMNMYETKAGEHISVLFSGGIDLQTPCTKHIHIYLKEDQFNKSDLCSMHIANTNQQ